MTFISALKNKKAKMEVFFRFNQKTNDLIFDKTLTAGSLQGDCTFFSF